MTRNSTLFASVFLALLPNTVLGQASFWLYNADPTIDAPVYDAEGKPLEGTDYLAELWGGSTPDSLSPALTYYTEERVMVPFTFGPGYFLDDYGGRYSEDVLVVFDALPGRWAWLEVRAWDARLGSTYEDVVALDVGGYGESPLFYAEGGVPGLELPDLPAPLFGLQSFNLRPIVPEPSGSALFMLGGMAWWWVRYRRGKS